MKKMVIGIDADGVIFDLFRYQLKEGLSAFKKKDNKIIIDGYTIDDIFAMEKFKDFKKYVVEYLDEYYEKTGEKIDYTKYDITDIFNCSHLRRQIFWMFRFYDYCNNSEVLDRAFYYIKKWQNEGKKVYNFTARAFVTDNNLLGSFSRKVLYDRYKREGINFDGIDLCSEKNSAIDKLIACNKRHVDFLLEDKANNACYVKDNSKFTNVLLLDFPYNEKANFDSNFIIDSLEEADQKINDYEQKINEELKRESYIVNNKLKRVKQEDNLTKNELLDYYQQRKEYYKNLPYDKEKTEFQNKLYKLAYYGIIPLFNVYNNTKVINKDKIPYQKGVIFAANHRGSLDQFALVKALGCRPVHFVIHEKLLKMKRGRLYENVNCISVNKDNIYSQARAMKEIIATLSRDEDVFLFPEGTRNRDKRKYLLEFAENILTIAQITGAPIIPMALNDEYQFRSKGVIVNVGDPIIVQPGDDIKKTNEQLKESIGTMIWENLEDTAIRKLESLKRKLILQKAILPIGKEKTLEEIKKMEKALTYSPVYQEKPLKLSKSKERRYKNF